jgi:hypothetical protein
MPYPDRHSPILRFYASHRSAIETPDAPKRSEGHASSLHFLISPLTHPLAPVKHRSPPRRSLASIGIPNHRDALAVYFRWVRQRYYRATGLMRYEAASSMRSTDGFEVYEGATAMQFDGERLRVDLLGVGARCENEIVGAAYPGEIVLG